LAMVLANFGLNLLYHGVEPGINGKIGRFAQ
jgi:hypothetical protein